MHHNWSKNTRGQQSVNRGKEDRDRDRERERERENEGERER
jgi:hypothetical protein